MATELSRQKPCETEGCHREVAERRQRRDAIQKRDRDRRERHRRPTSVCTQQSVSIGIKALLRIQYRY